MDNFRLDHELIRKILDRGNDVWIKKTKTGIVLLEVGLSKRQEIDMRPSAKQTVE